MTITNYVGQQVGNYRLIAHINSGNYGSIYLSKHVVFRNDPVVAIKLLHTHLNVSREQKRFFQEAQILRDLQHPHILPILDAGIDPNHNIPYLVTTYASRGSLRQRLRQPLLLEDALKILSQIGQALHYAHQHKIVHRDLKPENILFDEKGHILVADFGIAVVLETFRTNAMGGGGTPTYMAPEQFSGMVGPKIDQYALGCIAYELVTGRRLFVVPSPSLESMWFHHAKVQPESPRDLNPALPVHVEQAILKALAKNRADRHADVSRFITSLCKPPAANTATQAQIYRELGSKLNNSKEYTKALSALEQSIRLDANDGVAHGQRAFALEMLGRLPEALEAYEQALRLGYTGDGWAYGAKGCILERLGRKEEALEAYEQALRLGYTDGGWTAEHKALVLNMLKRHEEAVFSAEQALQLDPSRVAAYREKGEALENLGRYREALEAYEQVLRLDPLDGWTAKHRALVLSKLL